jgi:hypothetical protein
MKEDLEFTEVRVIQERKGKAGEGVVREQQAGQGIVSVWSTAMESIQQRREVRGGERVL